MNNRTAIVILIVAAGLTAFILLFERGTMTTSEREDRKGRVFVDFQRDAVTALTVRGTGGQRVSLERRGGEAGDPVAERWVITGGDRELSADAGAVRQVLSAIDFVLEDRVVREPGAAGAAAFGLAEPRAELSFTARGRTTSFKVGADATGGKVYLAVDGRDGIIAVEGDFLGEVDKSRDDLRDKRLVEQPLSSALAVAIGGEGAASKLARDDERGSWRVEIAGAEVLAAADRAANLLRELGRLEAARFVGEGIPSGELGKYGLEPAARVVAISLPGDGKVEVRLGAGCEADEKLIHATVVGSGTVACVDRAILDELGSGPERFRELRLAPVREEDVIRLELVRGKEMLTLEREEGSGTWTAVGVEGAPEIDGEAVTGLLGRLSAARASELTAGEDAVAGLGEPVARVRLFLAGDQPPVELAFHPRSEPERVAVRRGTEAALLVADAGLLETVKPDLLAFRVRAVVTGEVDDATKLKIDGPVAFTLEQKDDVWAVTAPVELAADGTAAMQLVKRAARIEVERFAAAAARPEHGLEHPFARVTATFAEERSAADAGQASDRTGEQKVVIEIGAEAGDGSRFARVAGADGAVFVLARSWLEDLPRPPVARDLLQFEAETVGRVAATHAGGAAEATREGEAWASGAPGFDAAAVGRAFADLAAVRTTRTVALGKDKAAAAVGEPQMILELVRDGEKEGSGPIRIHFGGPSDEPAEKGVLVRREGVEAAFVIPARIADDLLAALGLAAPAAPAAPEAPPPAPAE
ncbi:MAG TPA: DUF4340 domain-containing protein [Polyangia bacterium]|nr:DUF4340 domain-containing protein [Polyangia bacterium]